MVGPVLQAAATRKWVYAEALTVHCEVDRLADVALDAVRRRARVNSLHALARLKGGQFMCWISFLSAIYAYRC